MQVTLSNDMSLTSEPAQSPLRLENVLADFGAMFVAALPLDSRAASVGQPQSAHANPALPPLPAHFFNPISPTGAPVTQGEPAHPGVSPQPAHFLGQNSMPDAPVTQTELLHPNAMPSPVLPPQAEQTGEPALTEIMPAAPDEQQLDITEPQDDTAPMLASGVNDTPVQPLAATTAPQPDQTEVTENTPRDPALPVSATVKSADATAPTSTPDQSEAVPLATPTTAATDSATIIPAAPAAPPVTAQNPAAPNSPPIDMLSSGWTDKLVQHAGTMATHLRQIGGVETLVLTLTPERLGQLQIRLDVIDGVTHVYVIAETAETTRLMQDAQTRLNDLMTRAGLEMAGGSGNNSQGNAASDQTTPMPRQSAQTDTAPLPDNPAEPAPFTGARAKIDLLA